MGRFSKILNDIQSDNTRDKITNTPTNLETQTTDTSHHVDVDNLGPEALIEIVGDDTFSENNQPPATSKPDTLTPPSSQATNATEAIKIDHEKTKAWLDTKIKLHARLIDEIDLAALDGLETSVLKSHVFDIVKEMAREEKLKINSNELQELSEGMFNEMTGLGPLETLLQDETISDILINTHKMVFVERGGELELSPVRFASEDHLLRIINRIVSTVGRRVDESQPLCDARLVDGSRVNVAIAPIAVDGPLVSIRKFSKSPLTLDKLVEFGALPDNVAQFLWAACKARVTILISGGTGSGKTTLLNALSQSISEKERLITIEDAAELQLQQPHVARMETRPPNIEGKGEIKQRGLVKNALRMRPDRVILGEVRGEEAFDMLQAMNTGHEGSMATLHANTPRDALTRLEQMVAMGDMKITPEAVAGQIASAVGIIVQATRLSDGQRKITSVSEVTGMEGAIIQMQEIFNYTRTGTGPKHEVIGEFRSTGIRPRCLDAILTRNIPIPDGLFEPKVMPVGRLSDKTIKQRVG